MDTRKTLPRAIGDVLHSAVRIRHADSDADLHACWPAMRELRPHLESAHVLVQSVLRMRAERYRVLAVWRNDEVLALAGYRLQENLIYGPFLYVDDLVTLEKARREKWGARLMEEVTRIAQEAGCVKLVLDTGLANALGQRFYFRQGLLTGAIRFIKAVEPARGA